MLVLTHLAFACLVLVPGADASEAPTSLSGLWKKFSNDLRAPTADPNRIRAKTLMQRRSLADCEKAVELYETALKKTPEDPDLCLECADALSERAGMSQTCKVGAARGRSVAAAARPPRREASPPLTLTTDAVMRIKTNSNTLHISKMLDTKDNKKVWAKHGPRSLTLASKAKVGLPKDADAFLCYCNSFFFANSVKGVLAAATTGSGLKFKANAKELISRAPQLDGGVGHCYLGAFYLMAPWPLCNARLAKQHLHAAHKIVESRRNCYYLGVMYYRLGDAAAAVPYFKAALKARCNSPSERDFGDFILREAADALRVIEAGS
eukprot:5764260-Prymnesium_polylepis.1